MGIINSLLAIIQYWSIMLFGKIQENKDCIKSHRVNYYILHQGGCVFAGRHGVVGRSLNNMVWCPCWRHAIWKEWMRVLSPGQLTSWFSDSYFFLFFLVSTHFTFHRAAVLTVWLFFQTCSMKTAQTNQGYEIIHHSLPNQNDSTGLSLCGSAIISYHLLITCTYRVMKWEGCASPRGSMGQTNECRFRLFVTFHIYSLCNHAFKFSFCFKQFSFQALIVSTFQI